VFPLKPLVLKGLRVISYVNCETRVNDFKKYDTEDNWTYGFSYDDLREISEDAVSFSQSMTDHLTKHGFMIFDTSNDREQILYSIVEDIKSKEF